MARKIAARKIHFAPLESQAKAVHKAVRSGRHANVTALMRAALDLYLESERPSLAQQAQWMAEEWVDSRQNRKTDGSRLQDASRRSDERW